MIAFFLLSALCNSQRKRTIYSSFNSDCPLLNFGFLENGKFDMKINSSSSGRIKGILASSSEVKKMKYSISNVCNKDFHVANINFSIGYSNMSLISSSFYHWKGNVNETSVYYLYLFNCDVQRSVFTLESVFSNPESYLDSRDEILLHLYLIFAIIYFIFSIIWLFNAVIFLRFRVPLHTIFLFLPIIRCVVLLTTSSAWADLKNTGYDNISKSIPLFFLNLLFYTLLFIGVAFASTGFFIFRKFNWKEANEIIISSFSLSIGILMSQLVNGIQQAFFSIGILVFSLIWYLKQCIVSMIIAGKLGNQMKEPQVVAKIKLAFKFAIQSFILITLTILFSLYSAVVNTQKSICSSVLEIGIILSCILQLKSFLLRKQYLINEKCDSVYKIVIAKPKVMCTPNGSELVLLVQEVLINDY